MKIKNASNTHRLIAPALDRRRFLARGMAGAASLSLRSLATGLPLGFLLGGHMPANAQVASATRSLILGMSDDGESLNVYAPGAYGNNSIDRVTTAVGNLDPADLLLGGQAVSPADFASSSMINMGGSQHEAATFWNKLPQGLLDQMSMFHLKTGVNGHPEGPIVHGVHGALMGENGRGVEEIQSAIMQEILRANTNYDSVLSAPLVLNGGGGRLNTLRNKSIAISRYSPLDIKNLFLGASGNEVENLNKVYDSTIDAIYKSVKATGTTKQKQYLDAYASSRTQASLLGGNLASLLDDISGESKGDQARASVALAQVNIAPVIVVRYAYSADNHEDGDLRNEYRLSVESLNNIVTIYNLIQEQGLQDKINYATYDIFGRTFQTNSANGRDHHNSSCTNMMFGTNIKPGVIGGIENWSGSGIRLMRATGINPNTGLPGSQIPADETLMAYCATLMASVGISEERIKVRLPASQTVTGALLS